MTWAFHRYTDSDTKVTSDPTMSSKDFLTGCLNYWDLSEAALRQREDGGLKILDQLVAGEVVVNRAVMLNFG